MKIVYSEYVAMDIEEIYEYIAVDDEGAAYEMVGRIEHAILNLLEFPQLGSVSKIKELHAKSIRMIPIEKYLVFYKINKRNDELQILRIIHGARDYEKLIN